MHLHSRLFVHLQARLFLHFHTRLNEHLHARWYIHLHADYCIGTHSFVSTFFHSFFAHVLFAFWAAAPMGLTTYAFTHMGNFLLLLLLHLLCPPLPNSNPSFEAQISVSRSKFPASRPKSDPSSLRPKSHPKGPDPNLKAQIPALRPSFRA